MPADPIIDIINSYIYFFPPKVFPLTFSLVFTFFRTLSVQASAVAADIDAKGFSGWGVAAGVDGLPPALDPGVSLKARQLQVYF